MCRLTVIGYDCFMTLNWILAFFLVMWEDNTRCRWWTLQVDTCNLCFLTPTKFDNFYSCLVIIISAWILMFGQKTGWHQGDCFFMWKTRDGWVVPFEVIVNNVYYQSNGIFHLFKINGEILPLYYSVLQTRDRNLQQWYYFMFINKHESTQQQNLPNIFTCVYMYTFTHYKSASILHLGYVLVICVWNCVMFMPRSENAPYQCILDFL